MKCPDDSTAILVHSSEGRSGWKCSTCSGIWLPRSYIDVFEIDYPDLLSPFYKGSDISAISTSNRQCLDGHGQLSRSESAGIELDWCKTCRGFWFDKGELAKIQAAVREDKSSWFGWEELLWFFIPFGGDC